MASTDDPRLNLRDLPVKLRRVIHEIRQSDGSRSYLGLWTNPARAKVADELRGLKLAEVIEVDETRRIWSLVDGTRRIWSLVDGVTVQEKVRYLSLTEKGRKARWGSKPPRLTHANGPAGPAASEGLRPAASTGTPPQTIFGDAISVEKKEG